MLKKKILIVAEAGNTHGGSVACAKTFIRAAAGCGADIVKFQTHIFDAESLPGAPNPPYFKGESRQDFFRRTAFTAAQWRELKKYAENRCGIEFMSSAFSEEAFDLLDKIGVARHKIPSGEVTNIPLLKKAAASGRPVLISTGMSSTKELDEAVLTLRKGGCRGITILQCTSIYPCPPQKAGLDLLEKFKKRYRLPVGFSDHTTGYAAALGAAILGAEVIEKHFTLSRKMYGPDARYAMEPAELKLLIKEIRDVEKIACSDTDKDVIAGGLAEMKIVFEKSVVSLEDIPRGTRILRRMVGVKKPGNGLPPARLEAVIGKRAKKDIEKNRPVFSEEIVW